MRINFFPNTSINFRANKMPLLQAKYFDNTLKNSKDVDIICHEDTDKDSASSAVAIYNYLKQSGINSRIIISQDLKDLHLEDSSCNFLDSKKIDDKTSVPETVLCVDFSSDERIDKNTLEHLNKAKNVLCIDHHRGINLTDHDYTYINKEMDDAHIPETVTSFYIDSTAKSNTAIIYRFFEALGTPIDEKQAYSLMSGLISDGQKRGLFTIDGKKGTLREEAGLFKDTNTLDVYESLKDKLSKDNLKQILKEVDITANLNEEEKKFQASLIDKLKLEFDGELAYIILPRGDKSWKKVGRDNPKTSAILNKFRKDVLNNTFEDDKLNNVKIVMIFYEADDKYKVSFHSKINLHKMYDLFDRAYKNDNNSLGGHSTRGGGRTILKDNSEEEWVQDVLLCAVNSILRHKK